MPTLCANPADPIYPPEAVFECGVDSMHRIAGSSSLDLLHHGHDDSNGDSGMGDSCSSYSNSSCDSYPSGAAGGAAGPTDFAAMNAGGSATTQKLNCEMASMHIKRKELLDEGIDDDENARDCDSSFSMMPPPAIPVNRRVLGDIKNSRINSPVSRKRFSRNESARCLPTTSANSTGGLRCRKRANRSPAVASPFGTQMGGKRWRVTDMMDADIDEDEEVASTSYAPRTHSMNCCNENAPPAPRNHFIHRVQSTSVLERGIYAHHHDDDGLPAPLQVSYALPSALAKADSDVYRRICGSTLSDLMRRMGDEFEKSYALIDCRYPYEYEGGHIKGATNVYDPTMIDARFFSTSTSLLKEEGAQKIPIFYCEFSQKRGPSMALAVRAMDRLRNQWPRVDHAEMYVLNGGYKGFHEDATRHGWGELCAPFSYIQMEDPVYKTQMDKFRFHKSRNLMSFSSTVSRLPSTNSLEAKQALRAERAASQNSPLLPTRRASRRALVFNEDGTSASSPLRTASTRPLPNPQFS